jgi:galactose mutarotase-like enzyme
MPGRPLNFICVEPMAGLTNATNMKAGKAISYLQAVAAGSQWTESFWIRPQGF